MKRLLILIVITQVVIMQILAQASALEAFDPRTASYIEAQYSEFGNITVVPKDNTMPYLKLNLYSFPRESETLKVYNLETSPQATQTEKDSEQTYQYEWRNVGQGIYNYKLNTFVKSSLYFPRVNKKIEFPFYVPDELKQFTQATKKTESDDLEIKRQANEITAGETDAYKIAFKLADWVHEHTTYDEAYWQQVYSAKEVLESGRGVCDEYSNLFIALARSVGLPARYVVGSVYTNLPDVNDFQYHAWAEVWLPDFGWIPFDPTFAEYGWVDPTHIVVRKSLIVEPVSILYAWQSGEVSASNLESKIKIVSKQHDLPDYINSEIWLQEETVKPGSYNILWAQLENTQDFYIHTAAWLSKAPSIEGNNQKEIILAPKEKKTIGWAIKTPSDLDEKYIYTYTIESNALFSQNKTIDLKVDPRSNTYVGLASVKKQIEELDLAKENKGSAKISVELAYPTTIYLGKTGTVAVKIRNAGTAPDERFRVCIDTSCKNIYVGINDYVEQNFTVFGQQLGTKTYAAKYGSQTQQIQIMTVKKPILMAIMDFLREIFQLQ